MSMHVIQFDEQGRAKCLWTDALPLADLGKLEVTRASTVEFDPDFQIWVVWIDGEDVFESHSRETCIAWESSFFNQKFLTE